MNLWKLNEFGNNSEENVVNLINTFPNEKTEIIDYYHREIPDQIKILNQIKFFEYQYLLFFKIYGKWKCLFRS